MNIKSKLEQRPVREWMRAVHRLQPYHTSRALWLAAASAAILSVVMALGAVDTATHRLEPGYHLLFSTLAYLVLFVLLYFYNFWTIRCGLKELRLTVAAVGGSMAVAAAFAALQRWAEGLLCGTAFNNYIITLTVDTAAALIASLVSLLLSNVTLHQQAVLENEHLAAENMRIRFETLERQVSPHFLFNSLNTLDGLVGVDNEGAHRYIHALADNFRYTLSHSETVTLEEELEFTRNYVAMMQMRYGSEALRVEVRVPEELLARRLPPISVQLAVENAVKHNVATRRRPLTVTIEGGTDILSVRNAKQPKDRGAESGERREESGYGLANLGGRYALLFGRDIGITDTETEFTVELPLI